MKKHSLNLGLALLGGAFLVLLLGAASGPIASIGEWFSSTNSIIVSRAAMRLPSLTITNVTASRSLYLNGSGDVTNVTGTPDGTKFVRDDGVLAVPAGSGTPGGSTTQIQYNNAGAFGGNADFTYDQPNGLVVLGAAFTGYGFRVGYNNAVSGSTNRFEHNGLYQIAKLGTATTEISVIGAGVEGSVHLATNTFRPDLSNHLDLGSGLLPFRTNYANALVVNDSVSVGQGSTEIPIWSMSAYNVSSFGLTRATNSPAETGVTNDFQFSQSAKLGDTMTLMQNSAGMLQWTNGIITLLVTDTNQASINVDCSLPYNHYVVTTSRTNFDVAFSNTYNVRLGRSITVEFPTNLTTTSVQVTNKDAQTVRWNRGVTTNGAPSIVKTNINHFTLVFTFPTTNYPVIDHANY